MQSASNWGNYASISSIQLNFTHPEDTSENSTWIHILTTLWQNNWINPIHQTSTYHKLKIWRLIEIAFTSWALWARLLCKKYIKAVGELLGNSNTVEEVTEHRLLKKMAQSSALFCREPTSILTPHLLLTLCSTMCLLAFGQTVWYTWLVQASVCFNTLTLCCAIVVQSLSIKRPQPCPGSDDLPWLQHFYSTTQHTSYICKC